MAHPPHPLATLEQLTTTPSMRDGLEWHVEKELRVVGCMHVQEMGVLLELPQSTIATAQVLLHRFFYVSSMVSFGVLDIALASLYLASKLCETIVRLRDLLNVHLLLEARNQEVIERRRRARGTLRRREIKEEDANSSVAPSKGINQGLDDDIALTSPERISDKDESLTLASKPPEASLAPYQDSSAAAALAPDFTFQPPSFHSRVFYDLKDALVVAEVQILKRLGFNMQVDLPYSHMVNYCKILDLVGEEGVVQRCWGILNDALQTPIYVTYPPSTVACFSILLATRLLRKPLPNHWWTLFDADYDDLWDCCGIVMHLWEDWGTTADVEVVASRLELKEERWNRAWKLASSKRAVRALIADEDGTNRAQAA